MKSTAILASAIVSLTATMNVNAEEFKAADLANTHLAKAQYYRWFQLYERDLSQLRIENQLDILSDDIQVKSGAGHRSGKQAYTQALSMYQGWQNAHHVEQIEVMDSSDGLRLSAAIEYQGIKPNGERNAYQVEYQALLAQGEGTLPRFSSIELAPTGKRDVKFVDAYPENRARSLTHYWLGLIEKLDGNIEPFKEILADEFEINFPSQTITSLGQFEQWSQGIPSQIALSTHYIDAFDVSVIGPDQYQIVMEFDWYGVTKDDQKLRYRTKHTWQIVDDINQRFARITKIDVEALEPLRVVE
ncbi:hypothetical protein [Vibrio sp. SCSIO 43136]|uniref:hypothetical protein n=1 Tax=Vibrio sp. SCSIO 43136 TaxID=2819101 RepID=UPI0020762475|nr:hypothetical protein [Vibrio sp. SCSIO 43136]USD66976.1 hypothetical protein J4N39_20265 [Vibrio sp. SCSIO 43136]